MSIYSTQYKVKNPETGRQILKTKYRVQVRRSGQSLTKLCDTREEAEKLEKQFLKRIEASLDEMDEALNIYEETSKPDMRLLLWMYYTEVEKTIDKYNRKSVENRCCSAIPKVKISSILLPHKHRLYATNKEYEFGAIKVQDCDVFVVISYITARRKTGIKDNTILRELSTISCAFEQGFMSMRNDFPDGLINPVRLLPRAEKPKPYLGRKRVLSQDEAIKIAEWLSLKENREPFMVFILCLETGMRKSECLRMSYENVDFEARSVYLPTTKNGKSRTVPLPDHFTGFWDFLRARGTASGPIFKLTPWNFRQYWVDALKALSLYDTENRLHFHDTRRTFITKYIKSTKGHTLNLASQLGVSPVTVQQVQRDVDAAGLIAKFKSGNLTEQEFLEIVGHSNMTTHNIYNGDRS